MITYHRPGCPALSVTASLAECTGDDAGCASGEAVFPIDESRPRPIERYARAQIAIGYDLDDPEFPALEGPTFGYVEIGLHYEDDEPIGALRERLVAVASEAVTAVFDERYDADLEAWAERVIRPQVLDDDIAASATAAIDARIVSVFGDRPRFVEIWRGESDDEPLTQWYAPHGWPRSR